MIYICHPFRADPDNYQEQIREIARCLAGNGQFSIAPQLYLPQFLDEATERDLALTFCLQLLALCDEVRVYGEPTEGMLLEIEEAERLGIPVLQHEVLP